MPKPTDPPPAYPLDHPEIAARRERVWRIATSIPDADVEEQNGHYMFLANGKRFGWLLYNHHGDERLAINCKAERGENARLAAEHPDRYHLPAYVAHQGWLGLWLDQKSVAWGEVERVLGEARALSGMKAPRKKKAESEKSEAAKKPSARKSAPAKRVGTKASAAPAKTTAEKKGAAKKVASKKSAAKPTSKPKGKKA